MRGLDAIEEIVGRSVELGRPINFTPGFGTLDRGDKTTQALAGYTILEYTAMIAGKLGATMIVTIDRPEWISMAEELVKNAYKISGNMDGYDPKNIRFISDQQMPFAGGVCGILERQNVGGNILIGPFLAESLIIAETGAKIGAMQLGGTAETGQLPFFAAVCDYILIGEELYAAGAYLSKEPNQISTILVSDYVKLIIIGLIILAVCLGVANIKWLITWLRV
jgi:hypothetical protein